MLTPALSPSPTNPEMTQTMSALDIAAIEREAMLPESTLEKRRRPVSRPKRVPVREIAPASPAPNLRPFAIAVTLVLGGAVAFFAWKTHVPRFELKGQPPGGGVPVVVMLQGADQPQETFAAEANRMVVGMPDAAVVMVNAPHDSRYVRRWVLGPDWSDVDRSKAESFAELDRVVDHLREAGVADGDIYIGGYDEGGQVALDYAANREGFAPAGLILLSAGLPPWPVDDLSRLGDTRAFLAHGQGDREAQVLATGRLDRQLRDEGAQVETFIYAGQRELDRGTAEALAEFVASHE